jgi:hypothetical protein
MTTNMQHKPIKYRLPNKLFFFIASFIPFVASITTVAQQLDFDEVRVIAPYEPTISDAFKINFNPKIEDTIQANLNFDYSITPQQIPVRFNMEPLSPARMRGEPLAKLYKGYAKAGLGSYVTPYAEAFYNTLRSNEYHYGMHVKHLSSMGTIDDYGDSGYSDNLVNVFGKRFLRNHTLDASLGYERNMVHFYGFRPDSITDQGFLDTLKNTHYRQRFNYVSPQIGVRSNYLDSTKLQHSFNLRYYYFGDSYDASEQRLAFSGTLQKTLKEDPMGFAERQTFRLDLGANYFNNNHLLDNSHTGLFKIAPTLSAKFKDFDFFVGVNAMIQADTASYARFYPLAGAQATLIKNVLYAYASLTGDLQKHTMHDMTRVNPFMYTSAPYAFMNKKSEIRGGFKGSISSFAAYNISISNSTIENYPLFVNDFTPILGNQFNIIYDDIRLFNFRTEIFSNIGERLKIRFASDYFQYTLDTEQEPWHEPTLRLNLNLKYNIQDKIILSADAYARNSIFAKIPDATDTKGFRSEEIHGFHVDASLGIEYRYTKILSVFLNLNNLQNQALERWYNYPSQKFNVLGGVTYAF